MKKKKRKIIIEFFTDLVRVEEIIESCLTIEHYENVLNLIRNFTKKYQVENDCYVTNKIKSKLYNRVYNRLDELYSI